MKKVDEIVAMLEKEIDKLDDITDNTKDFKLAIYELCDTILPDPSEEFKYCTWRLGMAIYIEKLYKQIICNFLK